MTKAKVLTQREVETAKPKPKRYGLRDGIVPGMRLIVHPTGKKGYWLWTRVHGKLVPLEVGDALLMTLAEARAKAKGMLAAIANGEDPRAVKAEKAKAAADTVEVVGENFIERHVKAHNKPRTAEEHERLIRRNIFPVWGRRPITSIKPRDVIELIDAIVDRDAPIAANRTFTMGRTLFNWALDRHLIESSPFARVKLPSKETSRDRTPVDFELALVLRAAAKPRLPLRDILYPSDLYRSAPRRSRRLALVRAGRRPDPMDVAAVTHQERPPAFRSDRARGAEDSSRAAALCGSRLRAHDDGQDSDFRLYKGAGRTRFRDRRIERWRPAPALGPA